MKKILWLTADYFIDVDLPILPVLSRYYKIKWLIVLYRGTKIDYRQIIDKKCADCNIEYEFIYVKNRASNPMVVKEYWSVIKMMREVNADLNYFDISGLPYFYTFFYPFIDKGKSIVALHNVTTPRGAANYRIANIYNIFIRNMYKNFQVFSENQYKVLHSMNPDKKILNAPLALKDFGIPTVDPNKILTFLFFGLIRDYKKVDVLIKAAQNAYKETGVKFKVCIAGKCEFWEKYEKLIIYPELFELRIESIPNEDIPNLFNKAHYFVMPYQGIAQSGAMAVALRYNIPIIASDLDTFHEFMIDKETGFFMKVADEGSLTDIFINIIHSSKDDYALMKKKQKNFVDENLSTIKIANQYKTFFDTI